MQIRVGLGLGMGVSLTAALLAGCSSMASAPKAEGGGGAELAVVDGVGTFGGFLHPKARAGYGGDGYTAEGTAEPTLAMAPPSGDYGGAPPADGAMDFDCAPGDDMPDADILPEATPETGRRVRRGPRWTPTRPVRRQRPPAGRLTAGEHRDLDNWQEFRGRSDMVYHARTWGFDTARRIPVVVSSKGMPVTDASVKLLSRNERVLWEARTDNRGRAELFPDLFKAPGSPGTNLSEALLIVEAGAARAFVPLTETDGSTVEVDLADAPQPDRGLDVMLMVDATGSMSDELRYLQSELTEVLTRVQARQSQRVRLRTSVGVYRDHGDAYVVRSFPFTQSVAEAQRQLDQQHASGGGDMPEAVDEALETAVTQRRWSSSARARLLFLVLDAPPHPGTPANGRLRHAARLAASKGIRIIPVVASGSDKRNEGLLRSLAVTSGGTYTFLTDHSGIGNRHLKPSVSEVTVELLGDMLVRLIDDAVKHVGQPQQQQRRKSVF